MTAIDSTLNSLDLNKPVFDADTGYVFVTGIAARIGVQDYTAEYGAFIYRDADFVREQTLSLKGKPLTRGHFEQGPNKNKDKKVGLIVDAIFDENNGLGIVRCCLDDFDLCNKIKRAMEHESALHLGLSVGYRAPIIDEEGEWLDTEGIAGEKNKTWPYTKKQVLPVKTNHLAIVGFGRGGEIVKTILDEQTPLSEDSLIIFTDEYLFINKKEKDSPAEETQDGGALYPYPENHTSARKSKKGKTMSDEMLDKMSATCDKLSKVCDSFTDVADKMTKACDGMSSYNDAIASSVNYLEAIKKAYESQDRKVIGEYKQPTQEMIADEAAQLAEQGKAVQEAVALWVEFGDELRKKFDTFEVSADDLRKSLLSEFVEIEDGADIGTAFSIYRTLRQQAAANKPAKESAVSKVFGQFKDAAPVEALPNGATRRADGGISFEV